MIFFMYKDNKDWVVILAVTFSTAHHQKLGFLSENMATSTQTYNSQKTYSMQIVT